MTAVQAAALLPLPSPWALVARLAPHEHGRLQPAADGPPLAPAADTGSPLSRDEVQDYDHRFAVQRRQGPLLPLLLAGLQATARCFFQLVRQHPGLDSADVAQQREGLQAHAALLARSAGLAPEHFAALVEDERGAQRDAAASGSAAPSAWEVWLGFHWCFFLDTQGLVLALLRFDATRADTDPAPAVHELDTASVLLRASGAAMRLASAFKPQTYDDEVRPAMMPPQVQSDRFSGLMSWDHARLVRLWQQLRPVFAALPPALQPAHQRFVQAYGGMMEAHRGVCARFAGDEGASLRSRGSSSAVETLDRIGRLRLQSLDPGRNEA